MSSIDTLFPVDNTNTGNLNFDDVTLETLVGENQKYKSADELAKAYANAEAYLNKMKADLAAKEVQIETLKDIATNKNINSNSPSEPKPEPKVEHQPVGNDGNKNEKDINEIIREQFSALTEEQKRSANVNQAAETMKNFFGSSDKARQAVLDKAAEMNVSVDWLMDVAARSPDAMYRLMGVEAKPRSQNMPGIDVVSDVRTRVNPGNGEKNFRYFEEIRKSNPKLYYSRDIQSQMFAAAKSMGRSFYD